MTEQTEGSPSSDTEILAAEAAPLVENAESTPAEPDVKEAPKLVDVLRDVVKPAEVAAPATSPDAAENTDPAAEKPASTEAEPDDSKLPFGKHPRWKQVLEQRNTARQELETATAKLGELTTEMEQVRSAAGEFQAIEAFRAQNGLENSDIVDSLRLASLIKNDPDAALKALFPVVESLMAATGRSLPEDIRTDVEEGRITEDRGRELAQARAAAKLADERAAKATGTLQETRQQQEADRVVQEMGQAATAWEQRTRAKEPDFDALQPLVLDRMRAITTASGKPPASADDVVKLAQQALDDVKTNVRKLLPARPEIKPRANTSPPANASPRPTSMRDAIRNAV